MHYKITQPSFFIFVILWWAFEHLFTIDPILVLIKYLILFIDYNDINIKTEKKDEFMTTII